MVAMQQSISDDNTIRLFELKNKNGMKIAVTNFGATLVSALVPDRNGVLADVILGFKNPEDYKHKHHPSFGGIIGRFCNRIANAEFTLEGKKHALTMNRPPNHQHGGNIGFNKVMWRAKSRTANSITLTYYSRDGEEGYPGNMAIEVSYSVTDTNEIHICYQATSDQPTPVNFTNHAYFNLAGEGAGTIDNHHIQINSRFYTPVDAAQIPTGEIASVEGTPFDLRQLSAIANGEESSHPQMQIGKCFDINFVVDRLSCDAALVQAARVFEPETGRVLEVETTEPGMQFYTGQHIRENFFTSKSGNSTYGKRSGFCLETQHFPDSPNKPHFPSTILYPGQTYRSETVYRFSCQ